jgi:hypothetical protein
LSCRACYALRWPLPSSSCPLLCVSSSCPLLSLPSSCPSFIVRSSLCPCHGVLVAVPSIVVHAAVLAVVVAVAVTGRRSGFPLDTRAVTGSQGLVGIVIVVVTTVDDVPTAGRTVVIPTVVFIEIPVVVFIEVVMKRRDVIPLIQILILLFAPRS